MTEVKEIKRILVYLVKFREKLPKKSKAHREMTSDIEHWKRQMRKGNAPVRTL